MRKIILPVAVLAFGLVSYAQTPGNVTVINYAGFTGTFPVAPGSIASAYGDFGAGVATAAASSLSPMPREIAGIRLRVNSTDAPVYFVSRNQINFVVPAATPVGRQTVEVTSGGNVVARGTVNVYEVGPGLAALTAAADRPGIVQNQNFSVNGASAPARRGETIQIYATGCGATTPQAADGEPPAGLASANATVKAFFLNEEAPVSFAGAHPQFPGICQVNAAVPNRPFVTGQVPIFLTVNGIASNPVTVWVE